jgi:fatty-acyl-CoA synthase
LYHGGAALISDGFDAGRTLARIADPALGVTHYFCVPQMANMLRQHKDFDPRSFGGLTAIFTGGAPHHEADINAWLGHGIPVVDGFGMSETGTVFGMPQQREVIAQKAGCVGLETPMIEARIVDDSEQDCQDGTPGELLLRGENVFSGYWRRPEANEAAFTKDGWFRTGDIAVRDEDGFYRLVDRKKDMFISGGENVYPAEIEAALSQYPGIAECAVVGVPDARWGEVGHLAVVPKETEAVDFPAVTRYLGSRIARYKIPKYVSAIEALPRNGVGKIRKDLLRVMLADRTE